MHFLLHIFIISCVRILTCIGYNLILGKTKILEFGFVGFLLPVYYVLWCSVALYDVPFAIALFYAIAAVVVFAFIFARLSVRMVEDAYGVLSIALHLILLAVVLNWQSVTRGALGIPRIPRLLLPETQLGFAIAIGIVTIVWAAFVWWIDKGSLGRKMEALSEHSWHAESMGISRKNVHLILYLIAGTGALLQAIFYPAYLRIITPQDFQFPVLIAYVTIIIAGGSGKFWGTVIAAFVITILGEGLRFVSLPPDLIGPLRLMLFGLILFGAVWWRRDTLFPKQRSI